MITNYHSRIIDKLWQDLSHIDNSLRLTSFEWQVLELTGNVLKQLHLPKNIETYVKAEISVAYHKIQRHQQKLSNLDAVALDIVNIIAQADSIGQEVDYMNIMIDDDLVNRQTPPRYIRYTNLNDFITTLNVIDQPMEIDTILLDNDLGEYNLEGNALIGIMSTQFPNIKVNWLNMHSENNVAVERVAKSIASNHRHGFWTPNKFTTYKLNEIY